jgi:cell surface protein SprA
MFMHAESILGQHPLTDSDVYAVVRIGQDFLSNYYEIRIPLQVTLPNMAPTAEQVWPDSNNLDFTLQQLVQLKLQRDAQPGYSVSSIYRETIGRKTFSVLGNPNLGQVQGILIAVENGKKTNNYLVNTEVWVDELRLSDISESGGWSALGKVNVQLADLGTITASANTYSYGFGTIEQNVNERALNDMVQYDIATNIDAGKLLPKKAGITVPVYASIDKTVLTPHYDPFDQDVLLSYELNRKGANRDSIKSAALDQTTIKTLNFTNVRFGQKGKKPKFWSISNFDFSYSYTNTLETSPTVTKSSLVKQRGGIGYTYNGTPKYITPFKKWIKSKSPWVAFIKDFNFNLQPSLIGFRTDINKQTGLYVPRVVNAYGDSVQYIDSSFNNNFTFDRYYNLRWDLSKSLNVDFSSVDNAVVDQPYGLVNTRAKKDSVWHNFLKGGRNLAYQQRVTVSYNIPFSKFPFMDWVTGRYSYTTSYNWNAASLLAVTFGNTLQNSQQNSLDGRFDFMKLYAKSKFLKAVSSPPPPATNANPNNPKDTALIIKPRAEVIKGLKGQAKQNALRKWREKKRAVRDALRNASGPQQLSAAVRALGGLLTMVKTVSVNYSENLNSIVPGYMDSTKLLGENLKSMQPGYGYVFGRQPDTNWLNQKAARGLITHDTTFNLFFQQGITQNLNINAQLQPLREFMIDLTLQKTFSKQYQEEFKDTTGLGTYGHLSPYASGGFSVSYISFQTLFTKYNPNQVSLTFQKFQNNRFVISQRLAASNPYWKQLPLAQQYNGDGTAAGYGRYAQDVLIPAFIAAYTNKNPSTIGLIKETNGNIKSNPFSSFAPLPNWRINYTGLSKIPALAAIFSNISITHAYNSTLSMNSFTSAINYYDPLHLGAPAFLDSVSGNYVPYFLVPNITIQEQFQPLLGIDVTTKKQASFRFQYLKSRQLSLSLVDYQLSEVRSTGWTFGGSYTKKGVKLPFKLPFTKGKKLSNDLKMSLDLSIRDDTQSNSTLDQATSYSTGGQKVITIQPAIDYVMSNRVKVKFYFDQVRTIPYISTSAPITNTRVGMQINISLTPTSSGAKGGSGTSSPNGANSTGGAPTH